MQANNSFNERAAFVVELLIGLKDTCSKLKETSSEIEKGTDLFYEELFKSNISSIKEYTDKYKANIEKIKKLRSQLTEEINEWYGFIKDTAQIKKLSFPLKFQIRKRMLKNSIKRVNDSIAKITIENRFIKENLTIWEHKLELDCIGKIKEGSDYSNYDLLLKKKAAIIDELKYILPTIPEICPLELDVEKIDSLIETLKKLEHAA